MSRFADLRQGWSSRRRPLIAGLLVAALAALAVIVATTAGSSTDQPRRAAPAFTAATPTGRLDLTSLRGHRAVLAFVQAGCGSCAADLRNLGALAPTTHNTRFIALNLPGGGSARELQDFAASLGVHGAITYLADPEGQIAQRYGITAIDTVIVIDRNGQIRARLQSPGRSTLRHTLAAVPG